MVEKLIADVRGDQAGELAYAVVQLDEIVSLIVNRIFIYGVGLHAAGRVPAQAVVEEAGVLFGADLPVDLGHVDFLEPGARDGSHVRGQAQIGDGCNAGGRRADRAVTEHHDRPIVGGLIVGDALAGCQFADIGVIQ